MAQTILIVEDEPSIADTLTYALEQDGFSATWVSTGTDAKREIGSNSFDLIILDVGLPDINGFELFRSIQSTIATPVIFLTARNSEIDKVAGLEMGADDYISKPFSPREVTARVRAVLRRTIQMPAIVEQDSPFSIDLNSFVITYHGTALDLSRYEFRILELFINHPERVYSRSEIMDLVWDEPEFSSDRTVDTHIKKVRQKLREVTPDCDPIETRRGIGYRMVIQS